MLIRASFLTIFVLTGTAWADDRADDDKLMGTWVVEGSDPQELWTLLHKGEVQTIVRTEGGNVTLNLKCKPVSGECKGVDAGKEARVTTYSKGPVLVHWEVKDTNLIIRRFVLEGQTLTIEAHAVTGQGKNRLLRLIRRRDGTAKPKD